MNSRQPYFAFGISFYNDAASLERCLNSIFWNREMVRSYPFRVILVDGKYRGYPSRENLSTDGSREVAKNFVEDFPMHCQQIYDYPNLLERYKRQKYVDIAASQNIPFLIILDSDEWIEIRPKEAIHDFITELEYIEHEWKLHNKETGKFVEGEVSNVHSIRMVDMDDGGNYPINVTHRPRLWYRPGDMQYTTKHYYFKNRHIEPEVLQNWNRATGYKTIYIKNFAIYHSHDMREKEREQKRKFYENERLPKLES